MDEGNLRGLRPECGREFDVERGRARHRLRVLVTSSAFRYLEEVSGSPRAVGKHITTPRRQSEELWLGKSFGMAEQLTQGAQAFFLSSSDLVPEVRERSFRTVLRAGTP